MNQPAERLARYEDLLDLPEHVIGEIINGELHTFQRSLVFSYAYTVLGATLVQLFIGKKEPDDWIVLNGPELHLRVNVLVPDLAGWRRERMSSLPETPWASVAPDWVCEILSPSTARTDRLLKMPIYAREGVGHLWLLDPNARTLEVYALQTNGHWLLLTTLADDAEVRQPPFEAFSFSLGLLWP